VLKHTSMKNAFTLILLLCAVTVVAQTENNENKKPVATDFSIPPSPIFDLMGVTPSQVTKPSNVRNFKVDWSFKSWRLSPNLALQAQPIWELFYKNKRIDKYSKASAFSRMLSTLDVSVGTVLDEDNNRRIGVAGKLNLFRKADPLMYAGLYKSIDDKFIDDRYQLDSTLRTLRKQLDTISDVFKKPGLRQQIQQAEEQLFTLKSSRESSINEIVKTFILEDWNKPYLDIAWGNIWSYKTDSAGSLRSLQLNRNTGNGVWINGGLPLGKRWLLSGLARSTFYEEQVNFNIERLSDGKQFSDTVVAANRLYTLGLNLRYGSPYFSFFVELFVDRKVIKKPEDIIKTEFKNNNQFAVVSPTVKWTTVDPYVFTFGGSWRISNVLALDYGMRCIIDKDKKFKTFTPIVNLSCLMK
jgi:hypothetical protein